MKIIRINSLPSLLIALLIVPTAVFGWYLPIRNNTPYVGQFDVHYPGCNSDTVVVPPGQVVEVNAKGCLATQINGHLVQAGGKPVIRLSWSSSGHRDFSATIEDKGNGNFVIHPSYLGVIDLIQRDLVKPTEKAFVQLGQDIDKNVIQPIDFNVIKPIVGIGDTIGNIVSMALLIKSMIGPIKQTVDHITTQVDTLSGIKNGKDIVDPVFDILQELTMLPPHFQAILDKIAGSMSSIEDIVRPSSGRDADKIKQAAVAMRSISASVDQMTRKIAQLNQMLHVRVKSMAESANQVTNEIISIIK